MVWNIGFPFPISILTSIFILFWISSTKYKFTPYFIFFFQILSYGPLPSFPYIYLSMFSFTTLLGIECFFEELTIGSLERFLFDFILHLFLIFIVLVFHLLRFIKKKIIAFVLESCKKKKERKTRETFHSIDSDWEEATENTESKEEPKELSTPLISNTENKKKNEKKNQNKEKKLNFKEKIFRILFMSLDSCYLPLLQLIFKNVICLGIFFFFSFFFFSPFPLLFLLLFLYFSPDFFFASFSSRFLLHSLFHLLP